MSSLTAMEKDVRTMIGTPDEVEIPVFIIKNILSERSLSWINKRRPNKTITYFVTISNQQDYDAKPSTAYKITNVWWLNTDFDFFGPGMRFVSSEQNVNNVMSGFSVIDNPALIEGFYKSVSAYSNNFKGVGFETAQGEIRISPHPTTSDDKVYYEYTSPRWSDIINVSNEYYEGVLYFTASLALDYLFLKRGMIRSGRNFRGGGGANEEKMSEKFLNNAMSEIPIVHSFITKG